MPTFKFTDEAIKYTFHEIAKRLGVPFSDIEFQDDGFRISGVQVCYASLDEIPKSPTSPQLMIVRTSDTTWYDLLESDALPLRWLAAKEATPLGDMLPIEETVPVLMWGTQTDATNFPFAQRINDNLIVMYADIVASTFFMLSRWEETVITEKDKHARFPATASAAYRHRFLDRPIVDEYAQILAMWLRVFLPALPLQNKDMDIRISHDMDVPYIGMRPISSSIHGVAWAIIHYPKRVPHALHQLVSSVRVKYLNQLSADFDVYGTYQLLATDKDDPLPHAFYFMASTGGEFDNGYDPRHDRYRELIQSLQDMGHEIGFHPGYDTLQNPARFAEEKERLTEALGYMPIGGRQHYLRFSVPDTWHVWADHSMVYDSSLGYADYEGFRAGTCHPFKPFDVLINQPIQLIEYPLIVMDASLNGYRSLTVDDAYNKILVLLERCQRVGGTFTFLWHNRSTVNYASEWQHVYHQTIRTLATL